MSSQLPPLTIPFRFILGEEYDLQERFQFWDSPTTIQWFREHGYTLYQRAVGDDDIICESHPSTFIEIGKFVEADYPYACHDTKPWGDEAIPLRVSEITGKVIFAQDSKQRHVAIKLVRADSDEYRILRFLSEQSLETLRENCIIPVLDILPAEDFWLVVMPRWGSGINFPRQTTFKNILAIMHSMLKGLTFLHEYNIIHRDMKEGNMLTSHFSDWRTVWNNDSRYDLALKGDLSYAVFDFDISILAPPDTQKDDYRLPYQMSFWGTYSPQDTAQGEFEYNSFIFDVGAVGVVFCDSFQGLSQYLPMLAPLLDGMTTRDLRRRFTAAAALRFLEDRCAELSESFLRTTINLDSIGYCDRVYDEYDRWEHVPPAFAAKWAAYREPPVPLTTRLLRSIVYTSWFPSYIIPFIRWSLFRLTSPPRRIWPHFVGLRPIILTIFWNK